MVVDISDGIKERKEEAVSNFVWSLGIFILALIVWNLYRRYVEKSEKIYKSKIHNL